MQDEIVHGRNSSRDGCVGSVPERGDARAATDQSRQHNGTRVSRIMPKSMGGSTFREFSDAAEQIATEKEALATDQR